MGIRNIFQKKVFKLPESWFFVLIAFIATNFWVYIESSRNYDLAQNGYELAQTGHELAKKGHELAQESYELAKEAQEQPNLILSFGKQEVPGSVLQPTGCSIPICKESSDIRKFHYNTREINRINIINDSSVEAKRVRVKLMIKPDEPFVFSMVSVGGKYACQQWRISDRDKVYKYVEIAIDYIRGEKDDCNLYFVYAYPRSISKKKGTVEENALSVIVTWDGQKKTSPKREFNLEFHL